ncbi:MAG: DUF3500 domain-containing protein [Verrucomicrobiales bacterium]
MKSLLYLLSALSVLAASVSHAHETAEEMADAAGSFLATLDDEQREKAVYEITDPERENWHFVPKPFEGEGRRGGLPLKEMRGDQKHLAYALLGTGLSHRSYLTALQIMSLEQVLWELENSDRRNPEMYYFSIFGEPGSNAWGWRVEGHHLSVNFTVAEGTVVSGTPNFFASNPGEVLEGPRKGLRVLDREEDVARRLVQSLSDEQKDTAVVEEKAPRDILTSAEPTVVSLGDAGIGWGDLDDAQRANLRELVEVYVRRIRTEVAEDELALIEAAGWEKLVFSWAGGLEKGEPHYYRVQGPAFLLEYANTQNNANHVHAVWRDFQGDFGRDVLKEHYRNAHQAE